MKKHLLFSLALLPVLGFSQATQGRIAFEEYDLPNGLHVILHEDHSTPIVAISVLYHVGSKNENPTRTGFAHFFEHLLFEGSANIKRGEFDKYIQGAGGFNNANTSQDRTFYYEVLASNNLELGLWLESERMLHAKIEPVGVETQREVVKEEKRLRVDNQPYGGLLEEVFKRAYTSHPYNWVPIGSMEHLNAATLDEFMQFYRTYYVPNNATLSIAGDIDIPTTKALVEKYFKDIPRGKEVPRPSATEAPLGREIRDVVIDTKVQLPAVVQAYRIPEQGHPDFYALSVLNTLLADGESSRFTRSIVNQQEKAVGVFSFPFPLEHPGLFITLGVCNMNVTPQDLETAMNVEVDRLKTELVGEQELQKVRNKLETEFVAGNNSVSGIAENLANYHVYFGSANLINTEIERYMKVTPEDIRRVAQKYLVPENRVVLFFVNNQ
jgi:predicted Zn-dependent peptidase